MHLDRRDFHKLLAAAVGGMALGLSACTSNKTNNSENTAVKEPTEKHACKGYNTCKGQGGCASGNNGCKGRNDCSGKGGCATVEHHGCAGKNGCKGQGGCKTAVNQCVGKNECKGQGGCAVPVKAELLNKP